MLLNESRFGRPNAEERYPSENATPKERSFHRRGKELHSKRQQWYDADKQERDEGGRSRADGRASRNMQAEFFTEHCFHPAILVRTNYLYNTL